MKLYPLKFQPIFKEKIWGGTKLKTFLDKPINSDFTGESWEISTVDDDISIVSNGFYEGKSLNELIALFPKQLLGDKVYFQFGEQFPLLFKFIDAKQDLSIQLHPNDKLAQERHNSFGKTEMWYVLQADNDSRLIVGFKEKSSPEKYLKHLKEKSLESILDNKKVKEGDVFFLETGTIHAIGAGVLIAEIQQTSDITYRVYDWDRVDDKGDSRELHIDLALEAINYNVVSAEKVYDKYKNIPNAVVDCQYFTTNFISLDGEIEMEKSKESFTVYMCVGGEFIIQSKNESYKYRKGDTVLIPAEMNNFRLNGTASLLEIYIS